MRVSCSSVQCGRMRLSSCISTPSTLPTYRRLSMTVRTQSSTRLRGFLPNSIPSLPKQHTTAFYSRGILKFDLSCARRRGRR
uniref:Uncharacterized protein n=1 Tax=Arundo donax TaxID=35708 RepID=A0A0A9DWI2_ARUDO